jgi:hypothetical protein
MTSKFQEIRELVKKYPNNFELGEKVREFFYNLDTIFDKEEFRNKKIYESPDGEIVYERNFFSNERKRIK